MNYLVKIALLVMCLGKELIPFVMIQKEYQQKLSIYLFIVNAINGNQISYLVKRK